MARTKQMPVSTTERRRHTMTKEEIASRISRGFSTLMARVAYDIRMLHDALNDMFDDVSFEYTVVERLWFVSVAHASVYKQIIDDVAELVHAERPSIVDGHHMAVIYRAHGVVFGDNFGDSSVGGVILQETHEL